jgi:hypothetical protein
MIPVSQVMTGNPVAVHSDEPIQSPRLYDRGPVSPPGSNGRNKVKLSKKNEVN